MSRSVWATLRDYLDRPGKRVGLLVTLSLLGGSAEAVVLMFVVSSTVRSLRDRPSGGLPALVPDMSPTAMLVVAASLGVLVIAFHWWSAVLTASLATEVQVRAQHRLVDAFLGATWSAQASESTGLLQETVTVHATQAAAYVIAVAGGISAFVSTAVLLGAAFLVNPLMAVIVLGGGSLLVLALRPLTRAMFERARRNVEAHADLTGEMSRTTRMAMEFRAFGVGAAVAAHLRAASVEAGVRNERVRRLGRFSRTVYRDLAVLLLVLAAFVMSAADDIDMVAFGSVVLLVVRAVNGAQAAYESAVQRRELLPYLSEVTARAGRLEQQADVAGNRPLDRIEVLEATDIGYAYTGGEWALRHLHLRLVAGEVVGVVGPSGGGKSTLVQLITRLRQPLEGSITVNGVPYAEISTPDWTSLVAVVPQEPDLVEASIAANIVFWRTGISREAVERAARLAHVYDEIAQLPAGFDTMLGPDGQGLSGGQKQRIAIARALAASPNLLVLDEPTSALDAVTESLIRDTITALKGSVTVVVVAHRPTTLGVCDRIVTIEAGTLVSDRRRGSDG